MAEADQFKVGQSVVLEGTGTHWSGMTWHATIVDIRYFQGEYVNSWTCSHYGNILFI